MPLPIAVDPLTNWRHAPDETPLTQAGTFTLTNILFDADDGVMVTETPVMSVYVVEATENVVARFVLTTCNTLPAGIAAAARPVAFVRTNVEGVPRAGVVRDGLLANTTAPVPVEVLPPVPPLATGNVPVTVVTGQPVVPSRMRLIVSPPLIHQV